MLLLLQPICFQHLGQVLLQDSVSHRVTQEKVKGRTRGKWNSKVKFIRVQTQSNTKPKHPFGIHRVHIP